MTIQLIAGHDDTRPAWAMDLQLFADGDASAGEGETGDAGAAGGSADSSAGADSGAGDAGGGGGADAVKDAGAADDAGGKDGEQATVPDKYDLSIPEGYTVDENLMGEFTGVAKELGLNNDQANKLVGMHTKIMTDAFQALNEARNQEVVGWGESAKQELGATYDETLRDVAVGVSELEKAIPSLREAMDKTGFGNTIEGIKLMAAVGKLLGEDQGGKDAGGRGATTGPLYSDMANLRK